MKKVTSKRHRTPCRCPRCRAELEAVVRNMRATGQSLPIIADIVHVSVSTVWRMLKTDSPPKVIHGRDGKTYHYVASMRSVRVDGRVQMPPMRGVDLP